MSKHKIVLVTGCNRGIGLAACENLISKGHQVIATARDKKKGEKSINALRANYPNANIELMKLDVSSQRDVSRVYNTISKKYGHIDCLINNAGILYNENVKDTSNLQLEKTLQVNLIGPFMMCRKFLPLLKKSKDPKIINVSSQLGSLENSGVDFAAYRVSKSGLNSLTRTLHFDQQSEKKKIKVFCVCPGWVHTDMGGPRAPRTPEQGASSILFPFYSKTAKSGSYLQDGKILPW